MTSVSASGDTSALHFILPLFRIAGAAVLKSYSLVAYPPLTWQLTSVTPAPAGATAAANAAAGASYGGRRLKQVSCPGYCLSNSVYVMVRSDGRDV
jgi:hypothetical protein